MAKTDRPTNEKRRSSRSIGDNELPGGLRHAHPADLDLTDETVLAREQLARSEALLAGQKEAFQAAINGAPLKDSLAPLIRTAIELTGGDGRAAFYVANDDGTELRHVAGMSDAYASHVEGFKIGPDSFACGLATYLGEPVITHDVREDPRWATWLWLAEESDYRACWCFPTRSSRGMALGTLTFYFKEPRKPSDSDHEIAERLTNAAAIIISRHKEAEVRSQAEESLRRSQQMFDRFMHFLPGLAWIKDAEGKYLFANDAALDAFDTPSEKLYGHDDDEVFPPDIARAFKDNDRLALKEGGLQEVEALKHQDGSIHYSIVNKFPIVVSDGEPPLIGGMAIDITEQRRAQEALLAKEAELQLIADTTPLILARCSADLRYQFINQAGAALFGKTPEEIVGQPIRRVMGKKAFDLIAPHVEQVLKGNSVEYETRITYPATGPRWMRVHYMPEVSEAGIVTGWIASIIDVTELRTAQQAIMQSNLLIELSTEPIFAWNLESGIVQWNKGAEILYGYSREEALGRKSHELLRTVPVESFERFFNKLKRTRNWAGEVRQRTKDGRELIIESRQQLLDTGTGNVVLETNRDITERKVAEERERMLTQQALAATAKFESVFNQSGIFAAVVDLQGRLKEVNDLAVDFCGYTREEVLERFFWDTAWWRGADSIKDRVKTATEDAARGQVFRDVLPYWTADGTERWVDFVMYPIRDQHGEVMFLHPTGIDITERKAAEEALVASESRFRLAQNAGGVGIWDWDATRDQTYWSETMWEIYGEQNRTDVNPDAALWEAHIHPEDRERVVGHLTDCIRSDAAHYNDEFRIIAKRGVVKWIESSASITRDSSGRATRMYGVNVDITARRVAEERVRNSERELRLLTDSMPALICYIDKDRRYRFVNRTYKDWFGREPAEIIGRHMRTILGERAYRELKPYVESALAGEETTFETLVEYKDAGLRHVHVSYVPDPGPDGTTRGFYGLISDITELTRSKELLRTAEHRISMIVDTVKDYAVFSLTRDGRVDSWNTGAEHIFGWGADEILGLPGHVLFTPEDVAAGVPEKEMKTAREKGRASDERWHIKKDGSRFFASGVAVPLFVGRTLAGYAKIATDLTEKQRHAEELQRAHDELEERVVQRTRELAETNTALIQEIEIRKATEQQRIDLLRRLVTSQEFERRRIARDIHDQLGQRLTALRLKIASLQGAVGDKGDLAPRLRRLQEISEHLDSEVSFLAWELRPLALDEMGLAEALAAFVREWSRHYDIRADFHAAGLPKKQLDADLETHLYRITQEGLNNITKHAAAKNVTVLLEKRGDELVLIIEDDGEGFDPDNAPPPNRSGKGLGLVGMRERAVLAGGGLEIESAPGAGTAIFVRVPFTLNGGPAK